MGWKLDTGAAVLLLLLIAAAAASPAEHNYVLREPLPPVPPRRAPPRKRRSNPFPPQPDPTADELEVPPTDPRYPMYADMLWISYAESNKRPGPVPTHVDLSPAKDDDDRELTEFERWALEPFVPPGFTLPRSITSTTTRPRFERWSLAKAAYDYARDKGAPESMAATLRTRVARGLYEEARDFYRSNP